MDVICQNSPFVGVDIICLVVLTDDLHTKEVSCCDNKVAVQTHVTLVMGVVVQFSMPQPNINGTAPTPFLNAQSCA